LREQAVEVRRCGIEALLHALAGRDQSGSTDWLHDNLSAESAPRQRIAALSAAVIAGGLMYPLLKFPLLVLIGLDLGDVRHQNDIEQEVSRWAHTLADERFELLEKIAAEMAKVKGVKLPRKLRIVRP
jgi:hypothetical protein